MAVSLGISIAQNSQSIANNTSNITVNVIAYWSGGSYNKNLDKYGVPTASGWLSIDGAYYYFNSTFNDGRTTSGNKVIYSRTLDVSHDVEGKKNVYCSAYYATGVSSGNITASASRILDVIPRFATITSAPNFSDEDDPKITYSNPAGDSVTLLRACISLDGTNADIAYRDISKNGTSYTFNLTEEERDVLRSATTTSNSRTVKFYVRSEIGGSYQGSNLARTFTIKNPNPTINPTITDQNSATVDLTGDNNILVKYYSDAKVIIDAAAVKKATLKSKKVTCGTKSLTADGIIENVETNTFVFTATDSRGNNTTKTVKPSFVNYVKLTCGLANNIPSADGSMSVNVTGNYFSGSFGVKSNSLKVYYRYKPTGGTYSNWIAMTPGISGNTYIATSTLTGLDYQTAYVFQSYAIDELATVYSSEKTVKATPVFDWGEHDFRFNVPVSINGVDIRAKRCVVGQNSSSSDNPWYKYASVTASAVNEDMRISFKVTYSYGSNTRFGLLNAMVRTENESGENASQRLEFESDTGLDSSNFVLVHSGTGISSVYELWVKLTAYRFCMFEVLTESSRVSYTDNWTLYNQISAGYAAEPTADYTRVEATKPYLLNAWPIGSYYISANATSPAELFGGTWHRIESRFLWAAPATSELGKTAGEMTHTLTVDEMPSHKHDGIRYDHSGGISLSYFDNANTGYNISWAKNGNAANSDIETFEAGGGQAHNNMPPYVTVAIWRREA